MCQCKNPQVSYSFLHILFSFLEVEREIINGESLQVDFCTIRVATSYFSNTNRLGQGGFGAVYKVNN